MIQRMPCRVAALAAVVLVLGALSGCATTKSGSAKSLLDESAAQELDLRAYNRATVMTFDTVGAKGKKLTPEIASAFSDDLARRLREDFGPLFAEVRRGDPLNLADELIVTGRITKYKPGNRFGRAILIGVGAAHLEADLVLKNGGSGSEFLRAPVDKLWAWGGLLGLSKGIEDMQGEVGAMMAATVAAAKGWTREGGVAEAPVVARAAATQSPVTEEIPAQEELIRPEAVAEPTAPERAGEAKAESSSEVEEIAEAEEAESDSELEAPDESSLEQLETPEVVAASLEEPVESAVSEVARAPQVFMCYLGLEFGSEIVLSETVRVDLNGRMVALMGAGDKVVARYTEGVHSLSFSRPKASEKKREEGSFAIELRPFVYTKIVIEDISGKKRKRLIVHVLEDGEEVSKHTIDL